jgi:hypothetical protein
MPTVGVTFSTQSRLFRISERLHIPVNTIVLMSIEMFCNEYEPRVSSAANVTAEATKDPGDGAPPDPLTRQCSWCSRVWDNQKKEWVTSEPIGKVTHGMCPECQARLTLGTQ